MGPECLLCACSVWCRALEELGTVLTHQKAKDEDRNSRKGADNNAIKGKPYKEL